MFIAKLNKEKKLTSFDINFFFACLGLTLTLIYNCVITDEYKQLFDYYGKENGDLFLKMVLFSGSMGIVITLSILVVVAIGGPILVNIVGIIKDVALTYAGFILFDD